MCGVALRRVHLGYVRFGVDEGGRRARRALTGERARRLEDLSLPSGGGENVAASADRARRRAGGMVSQDGGHHLWVLFFWPASHASSCHTVADDGRRNGQPVLDFRWIDVTARGCAPRRVIARTWLRAGSAGGPCAAAACSRCATPRSRARQSMCALAARRLGPASLRAQPARRRRTSSLSPLSCGRDRLSGAARMCAAQVRPPRPVRGSVPRGRYRKRAVRRA